MQDTGARRYRGWQEETAQDLKDADAFLQEAKSAHLKGADGRLPDSVWQAYLRIEKSVAFIKVELDEESPGRFVNAKIYRVPDERQAVGFALVHLGRGRESFELGLLLESLKHLRESRNYLRVLLRRRRTTGRQTNQV